MILVRYQLDDAEGGLVDIEEQHPPQVGEIVGFNDAGMVRDFRVIKGSRVLAPPNRRGPDNRWPSDGWQTSFLHVEMIEVDEFGDAR